MPKCILLIFFFKAMSKLKDITSTLNFNFLIYIHKKGEIYNKCIVYY